MATKAWHAYFYDGLDEAQPPSRTEWIMAESEDEAVTIVRRRLEKSQRAELVRPRWELASTPRVVLREDVPEALTRRAS